MIYAKHNKLYSKQRPLDLPDFNHKLFPIANEMVHLLIVSMLLLM